MPEQARLALQFSKPTAQTLLHSEHAGPLRVLKAHYPEGPGICHAVVVHPPGGLVGGDELNIQVRVQPNAHALISTPGATRFYKSTGQLATQTVQLSLAEGATLEWLPLETLAYPNCHALNRLSFDLQPGAQLMAWDVSALGLPDAGLHFDAPDANSRYQADWLWPGHWLERAQINATDTRLLNSPLGFAGHRCLGTLVLAHAEPLPRNWVETLQTTLRDSWANAPDAKLCGCTQPNPRMLVVRCLGARAEPVMQRLQAGWALLRQQAWGLAAAKPRIWHV